METVKSKPKETLLTEEQLNKDVSIFYCRMCDELIIGGEDEEYHRKYVCSDEYIKYLGEVTIKDLFERLY